MLRFFFKSLSLLLFCFAAFILSLSIWLYQPGKKNIHYFLTPVLEFFLSTNNFKVKIGNTELHISHKGQRDNFLIENVQIFDNSSNNIGNIKEIISEFDLSELYKFKYVPVDIILDGFKLHLPDNYSKSDKPINDSFEKIIDILDGGIFYFHNLTIMDSVIGFTINDRVEFFKVAEGLIVVDPAKRLAASTITYFLNDIKHNFDLNIKYENNRYLGITADLSKLPLHLMLSQVPVAGLENLKHPENELILSGKYNILYDAKKKILNNNFNISELKGTLISRFDDKLKLSVNSLQCHINQEQGRYFKINTCVLKFNEDSSIQINGDYKNIENKQTLNISLAGTNIPTAVYQFFKTNNENDGFIKFMDEDIVGGSIDGDIKLSLDDQFFTEGVVAKGGINGKLNLKDITYNYDKDFPPLKHVYAKASIIDDQVHIDILSGNSGSSSNITSATVDFKWPNLEQNTIYAKGEVVGNAVDLTDFIPQGEIQDLKEKSIDLTQIAGKAQTSIKLDIPIVGDIKYDIHSNITNFYLPLFSKNILFHNGTLTGSFDGAKILISGDSLINGFKSQVDFKYALTENKTESDSINIVTTLSPNDFKSGFLKVFDGNTQLQFNLEMLNGEGQYNAKANLTNIAFLIDKIGLQKDKNIKSTFSFNGSFGKKAHNPTHISLVSDNGIHIKAQGDMSENESVINFDKIEYGRSKLEAIYKTIGKHTALIVKGPAIDLHLADLARMMEKESTNKSSEVHINLDKVYLKNDVELNNLSSSIHCNFEKCYKGFLNADLPLAATPKTKKKQLPEKKYFKMDILEQSGSEEWIVTSNDAGAIFKGLNFHKNVKGGNVKVKIKTTRHFDKAKPQLSFVNGEFHLKDFKTVKNPIMTKLVSFVSIPGLISAIGKNDVYFDTMDANFTYMDKKLYISDGFANGPYFDLSLQGTVDTQEHKLYLKGRVIPSLYGMSKILSTIPLIGELFGKKKGIIFAPYKIEENYEG